jgi:hypothetical protein
MSAVKITNMAAVLSSALLKLDNNVARDVECKSWSVSVWITGSETESKRRVSNHDDDKYDAQRKPICNIQNVPAVKVIIDGRGSIDSITAFVEKS